MVLVYDIETEGRPWNGQVLTTAVSFQGENECQLGVKWVADDLADPGIVKVSHTKYDPWFVRLRGYEVEGPYHDTQVMAWVLNENTPLDLEYLYKRYCGKGMDKRIKRVNKVPHFKMDDGKLILLTREALDEHDAWQQLIDYNRRDIVATEELYYNLRERLENSGWWEYYEEELVPYTRLLVDIETRGIPIDLGAAEDFKQELLPKIEEQRRRIFDILGYEFNPRSPKQLQDVLYSQVWYDQQDVAHGLDITKPTLTAAVAGALGVPKSRVPADEVERYKQQCIEDVTPPNYEVQAVTNQNLKGYFIRKGLGLPELTEKDPKTDEVKVTTAMPKLTVAYGDHPFVQELGKLKKMDKVVGTYLSNYPRFSHEGRLYGRFNQTGTKTGRLSSSDPNLQNQPAHGELGERVRSLFRGNLIVGDYSQLEPRLMAHFSGDPVLLDVYLNDKDIYVEIAARVLDKDPADVNKSERGLFKTYVLALGYGAGAKKLRDVLALNGYFYSVKEVSKTLKGLKKVLRVLFAWKESTITEAKRKGYVTTLDGHRRRLRFEQTGGWKNQGYGERQAVNARIQGSAGDVVRRAMLAADRRFPELAQLGQVHDEVLFEYDPASVPDKPSERLTYLRWIQECMETEHDFDLAVPLRFEPAFCTSWADKGSSGIILPEEDDD